MFSENSRGRRKKDLSSPVRTVLPRRKKGLSSPVSKKRSAAPEKDVICKKSPKLEATCKPFLVPDAPVGSSFIIDDEVPKKRSAAPEKDVICKKSPKLEATCKPFLVPDAPVGSSFIIDDEVRRPSVTTAKKRSPAKTPGKSPTNTPGMSPSKSLRRRLCFENSDSGSESDSTNSEGEDEWGAYCTGSVNMRQFRQQVEEELLAEDYSEDLFDQEVFEGVILSENDVTMGTVDETNETVDETFSFTNDFSTFTGQPEVYLNTPGPRLTVKDPTGLFLAVWDNEIMEHIVKETNEYAWQTIAKLSETDQTIPTYLTEWRETTVEELYRLFAVLNYMSIDIRSSLSEYWSTGILGMPEFRKIMSRNRFTLLTKFLHFVDNNTLQNRSYDRKISKIAPIIDHCNRKFSSMYTPHRSLSLDESLLLWKGRLSFAQTIRTKAARFGIKSYELCESQSGYLLRTSLYAGKNSSMTDGAIDGFENPTAKVVLELMDGFLDVGHLLTMDSWYNQLCLTRYLKKRHTDVVGTINRRRVEVPFAIKDLDEKRMQPGDQVSLHCGDITMIAWKDVRLVTAISTFHQPDLHQGYRNGRPFNKPEIIECYNKNMGGVDMKDQKLSMYLFERKRGNKWYTKVFKRMLNTSLLNTFIIYSQLEGVPELLHRSYRFCVSEGLLAVSESNSIRRPLPSSLQFATTPVRLRRGENYDHFPEHYEITPGSKKHVRRRCGNCYAKGKGKRSALSCGTCKVGLCAGCWKDYHTKAVLG